MSEQDYPMHGYLYNPDGTHGPPTVLGNKEELWTFVSIFGNVALINRLQFLITSGDDEDCYLEIHEGKVRYASGVDPQEFTQRLKAFAQTIYPPFPEEKV